ncbi:cytochrome P450 71D8-like [Nicotiana tabacum]|uniref:Cytochrome P450 71D8-like n=1 Tax=Nicotiana tabacum TaxID=4097 RepID=A0A1S3Y1F3_TOBAC
MRKLCTFELLSAKNVQSFASIREEEAFNLVEYVKSKSGYTINLTEKMYALTNAVICSAAFGKRRKDGSAYFMSLIKEASLMVTGLDISEVFPSLKFLHAITGTKAKLMKLHKKLDMIIEEHKEKLQLVSMKKDGEEESIRKEDLVNLLYLRLQESDTLELPFTADNIKASSHIAGTETSATVLDLAMVEMMRNPKVMEKAQIELRQILKGKRRVTDTDLKEVIVNAWAINRDVEFWEDAESFVSERFNDSRNNMEFIGQEFEYLPFGGGRRMCPGISFGLANIELTLAQLLYYFN